MFKCLLTCLYLVDCLEEKERTENLNPSVVSANLWRSIRKCGSQTSPKYNGKTSLKYSETIMYRHNFKNSSSGSVTIQFDFSWVIPLIMPKGKKIKKKKMLASSDHSTMWKVIPRWVQPREQMSPFKILREGDSNFLPPLKTL